MWIGGHGIVENVQPVTLLRIEQPLKPTFPIPHEFEKEFLLMATMGDVPDLSGNVMTVGSCHPILPLCCASPPRKLFQAGISAP